MEERSGPENPPWVSPWHTYTKEWRERHDKELEELFQSSNVANEIKKRTV
jgi:hypothetical protein